MIPAFVLTIASPAPVALTCHAISPAASDAWCNANCNHSPPNCPPTLCKCDAPTPPPPSPPMPSGPASVGAYHDLTGANGLAGLNALAENAATLPITRLFLAFVAPTLYYEAGSRTLAHAGLDIATSAADAGFAAVAAAVAKLRAGGVDVLLSMGGWNYNCFPAMYMKNSVAGYGPHTPNYWKVAAFGGPSGCTEANQYCYVCEPQSENTTLASSFSVFPEPEKAATWKAATAYVEKWAKGSPPPQWHGNIFPGATFTDPASGLRSAVPGDATFHAKGSDPYVDLVTLAKELNCSGVDIDYEEFWHADTFKTVAPGGAASGPWENHQTTYKYAAILKDVQDAIGAVDPSMLLTTAAAAVGGWQGKWWGGNRRRGVSNPRPPTSAFAHLRCERSVWAVKGVWWEAQTRFPSLLTKLVASGGLNVMTYDLSSNQDFHECPEPASCPLSAQVAFYIAQYSKAGLPASPPRRAWNATRAGRAGDRLRVRAAFGQANIGYEIGTPAYPAPTHDKAHQLPLTTSELATIAASSQKASKGGFLWQVYKTAGAGEASATATAQAVCKAVMPASPRCTGVFPPLA